MRRINIIVDILSLPTFLFSFFSGVILWRIFPTGQGFMGGKGGSDIILFLGMGSHEWTRIHIISSFIVAALIFIHLVLHWQWIKGLRRMIKK